MFPKLLIIILFVSLAITGCSGGGNSSPNETDNVTTVSGNALAGSPIVGRAWLKDSLGNLSSDSPVTIEDDGSFEFDITGLTAPYYLQAKGTVGSKGYVLHSASFEAGTANINPITDLAVAIPTGTTPTDYFENPSTPITEDNLNTAVTTIKGILQPLLTEMDADDINPLSDAIIPNHAGLDGVFDVINVKIESDGTVTVSDSQGDSLVSTSITNAGSATAIDTGKVTQLKNNLTALNGIIAFATDYYSSSPTRSSKGEYLSDDFFHNGKDKDEFLTENPTFPETDADNPVTSLKGFALENVISDDSKPYTHAVSYFITFEDGTVTQETIYAVKDDSEWVRMGNQYKYKLTPRVRWTKDIHADGTAEYGNGIEFKADDDYDQGIKFIVITGDGIENRIRLAIGSGIRLDIIPDDRTSEVNSKFLFSMSDETIEALQDTNLEYTSVAYADYDTSTFEPIGEPVETRTQIIKRKPETLAELKSNESKYFGSFSNLSSHTIADMVYEGVVQMTFSVPTHASQDFSLGFSFEDDSDNESVTDKDIAITDTTADVTLPDLSWIPTYGVYDLMGSDEFGRTSKLAWEFE